MENRIKIIYGRNGTGKTLYAEQLEEELENKVDVVKVSTFLNKDELYSPEFEKFNGILLSSIKSSFNELGKEYESINYENYWLALKEIIDKKSKNFLVDICHRILHDDVKVKEELLPLHLPLDKGIEGKLLTLNSYKKSFIKIISDDIEVTERYGSDIGHLIDKYINWTYFVSIQKYIDKASANLKINLSLNTNDISEPYQYSKYKSSDFIKELSKVTIPMLSTKKIDFESIKNFDFYFEKDELINQYIIRFLIDKKNEWVNEFNAIKDELLSVVKKFNSIFSTNLTISNHLSVEYSEKSLSRGQAALFRILFSEKSPYVVLDDLTETLDAVNLKFVLYAIQDKVILQNSDVEILTHDINISLPSALDDSYKYILPDISNIANSDTPSEPKKIKPLPGAKMSVREYHDIVNNHSDVSDSRFIKLLTYQLLIRDIYKLDRVTSSKNKPLNRRNSFGISMFKNSSNLFLHYKHNDISQRTIKIFGKNVAEWIKKKIGPVFLKSTIEFADFVISEIKSLSKTTDLTWKKELLEIWEAIRIRLLWERQQCAKYVIPHTEGVVSEADKTIANAVIHQFDVFGLQKNK